MRFFADRIAKSAILCSFYHFIHELFDTFGKILKKNNNFFAL